MSHLRFDGPFYSDFLGRQYGANPAYTTKDKTCIEATVSRLTALPRGTSAPGMLLGKVQSGKTKTFMAVMALSFDNGFDVAVILTKGTKVLASQTYKRVLKEFGPFMENDEAGVFDIMQVPDRFTPYELKRKLVIVVKKQTDNLDRLSDLLLKTYPELGRKRILIVDDEADFASIGYATGESGDLDLRIIAKQIDALRGFLPASVFLQVTATPYSLYLQPEDAPVTGACAPVRPAFTELVPIHGGYVGGDFYFEQSRTKGTVASFVFQPVEDAELTILKAPDRRRFKIEECLESPAVAGLRRALMQFIVGGTIRRMQTEEARGRPIPKYAFLFHTEAAKAAHAWQESVVVSFEEKLRETAASSDKTILKALIRTAYDEIAPSIIAGEFFLPTPEAVVERLVQNLAEGQLKITKVNSEQMVETLLDDSGQLKLTNPLNIFIGGQILDRGITIANLIGFFYGRNPKKFQQDTVLQHSRMYGARSREDCAVTRFHTTQHIHACMARMHETDCALRERIEAGGTDLGVWFIETDEQGRISPCSPNKILASDITTLRPSKKFAPRHFQTDFKTRLTPITEAIDSHLGRLTTIPLGGANPDVVEISLSDALSIVDRLGPTLIPEPDFEDEWRPSDWKAMLTHLATSVRDETRRGKILLLLRTDRDRRRTRDDGTLLGDTPDNPRVDSDIAKAAATDLPVLLLIRQQGRENQGWRDTPFWWPVLFTPASLRPALFAQK